MNRTVRQNRLLVFLLCAGIAVSLAQATLLQNVASYAPNGILSRGMAGRPETIPTVEKQQLDCANARPTFRGSVVAASIRATAPPSERAELAVFDKSYRAQTGLLRAHFGRAPPYTFSRQK
jgi:hypothetical protein